MSERKSLPDAELTEILDAHAKENAALLLRVAELEAISEDRDATSNDFAAEVASLRSQVATLTQERDDARRRYYMTDMSLDAAKADAARLREAAAKFKKVANATHDSAASDQNQKRFDDAYSDLSDAINITDSAAWLESKIAERTALHVEREKSLEASLVAATNDAARAELRARDLARGVRNELAKAGVWKVGCSCTERFGMLAAHLVAAEIAPDSDERLREVMMAATVGGLRVNNGDDSEDNLRAEAKRIVDEVLGVKS